MKNKKDKNCNSFDILFYIYLLNKSEEKVTTQDQFSRS